MNFSIWLCNLILFRLNLFTLNLNCIKLFEQKENKNCSSLTFGLRKKSFVALHSLSAHLRICIKFTSDSFDSWKCFRPAHSLPGNPWSRTLNDWCSMAEVEGANRWSGHVYGTGQNGKIMSRADTRNLISEHRRSKTVE